MLDKLASLSKSLNEASDELTGQIGHIEAVLSDLRLGVWAWVDLIEEPVYEKQDDGKHMQFTRKVQLGYGKNGRAWGLLIAEGYDEFWEEDRVKVTFLRDAPRDVRVAAVDKMPDLLEQIADKTAKALEEVTEKAAKAKEIATAVGKKRH